MSYFVILYHYTCKVVIIRLYVILFRQQKYSISSFILNQKLISNVMHLFHFGETVVLLLKVIVRISSRLITTYN